MHKAARSCGEIKPHSLCSNQRGLVIASGIIGIVLEPSRGLVPFLSEICCSSMRSTCIRSIGVSFAHVRYILGQQSSDNVSRKTNGDMIHDYYIIQYRVHRAYHEIDRKVMGCISARVGRVG